ncbi:MAG: uncharacterized protein JWQ45_2881 [Blastococcus sp.]|jgi:hypothetical protein|nr:uncharacterized protein [Blastococcus sp.]
MAGLGHPVVHQVADPVAHAVADPVGRPVANSVAQSIDGATGDWSMSGDAMRWSPGLAEHGATGGELRGLDPAVGSGAGTGLDRNSVRRLVSGALTSLGSVASDVVTELRQLTRGGSEEGRSGR